MTLPPFPVIRPGQVRTMPADQVRGYLLWLRIEMDEAARRHRQILRARGQHAALDPAAAEHAAVHAALTAAEKKRQWRSRQPADGLKAAS